MIYFDNAATTFPKPRSVVSAVQSALTTYSANPGRSSHKLSQTASETIYQTRKKLADFCHLAKEERVIFTPNCTASLNLVMKGILKPGDRVLISSMEHNAVLRPLHALKDLDISVDQYEVVIGDPNATFRSFLDRITGNTAMVISTHASNVIGAIMPIEQMGQVCREEGIPFTVDAAQTAGVLDIDMEKMGIDYLCLAPHKGLYAPMGTGALLIAGDLPLPLMQGGTGTDSINPAQPTDPPERYESGTVNLPGIAGLSAGLDFVNSKGRDTILTHEKHLMDYIYQGLNAIPGVRLYTDRPNDAFVPVLPFNIRSENSVRIGSALDSMGIATRAGLHCAPDAHKRMGTLEQGAVRICPSAFSTRQEADSLLNAVERLSKKTRESAG